LAGPSAASRTSKRKPPFIFCASGPWQEKQWSERIGRMSRLNWTRPDVVAEAVAAAAAIEPQPNAAVTTQRANDLKARAFME
jgi:hypothetical protein